MNPFRYQRADSVAVALSAIQAGLGDAPPDAAPPRFLAGGTNLIDLMKENIARPAALVDIRHLPLREIAPQPDGSLHLGALATNADTAEHPLVRANYPLLRSAILAGASPQIRNMATNGGNLLQRTRCYYFYDAGVPCNKRLPGSGCPAAEGLARQHAILGASPQCIATHPSDMCVALAALDAQVHLASPRGTRAIAFGELHRLPGDRPELDTTLADDELITHLTLPPPRFQRHSSYLKIRERASYAFALVSVAAALDLAEDGTVREARIALGGVAHKPWRDPQAEALLAGRPAGSQAYAEAAAFLLREARAWGGPALPESLPGNAFKIPLAQRAIVRALEMAAAGVPSNTGVDACRTPEIQA
ncbi:FAD binding domain-containing protein [Eleftheria terrae]|uniref:FAD binding domain-containing protein n=1 Tax=Eleftheria terrae TaxID=1597781 RepID=UPI00263BA52A|nr:xanthine dehydrogenase family protein subunit M [Eleftheria terrae]WKB54702.1 xanthine dehydrogenase family protein subunit M [Eleftheria terrae]